MFSRTRLSLGLLLTLCLVLSSHAADIDVHLYQDPVTVQVISKNCGPDLFTNTSRDYNQEYRRGVFSFMYYAPMALGTGVAPQNLPRSLFSHVTDAATNTTTWTFVIAWNETTPNFQPYDTYTRMASFCNYAQGDTSGACTSEPDSGGPLFLYVHYNDEAYAKDRQWLAYFDSFRLACCDGSWAVSRQLCPDCLAKNYLPLILGTTLGFVGAVLVGLAIWIGCRVQKRRKARRTFDDAGHKAPPKNIGPAFQPHAASIPHHGTSEAFMMRPNQMAHHAEPAVVVKVETPPGTKKHHKEEPDMDSRPEGTTDKGHSKHDKHDKHKEKDDKHHKDDKEKEKEKDKKHSKH